MEPDGSPEPLERVEGFLASSNLEMERRTDRGSGVADPADDLSLVVPARANDERYLK